MHINEILRWKKGRQNTGYDKMFLLGATWPLKFDVYLLRFPKGSEIPPHTDKVNSGKHFRLNIVIKHAAQGGEFHCTAPIYETKRIKYFRPDQSQHAVTKITQGTRYVFSIGWVRN